jgi:hypothetical protein
VDRWNLDGDLIMLIFISIWVVSPFLLNVLILNRIKPTGKFAGILPNLVYLCWISYAIVDIFFLHPDAQGAISLLFVPIFGLPVLAVIWGMIFLVNRARKK